MLTIAQLTGQTDSHVDAISTEREAVKLQSSVAQAYLQMREAAQADGVQMAIASGFRDFSRQLSIWNKKFSGQTKLYNLQGEELDSEQLTAGEKLEAILTWSALPGASRHHWGTDFDVYDTRPFVSGEQRLQLLPYEYEEGGPCYDLYQWLQRNALDYGFFFPYARYRGGVAAEPWHLSHLALAEQAHEMLSEDILFELIESSQIAGKPLILSQLPEIKQRYVDTICHPNLAQEGDIWFG
jgi:LAS superfamily LD-carboxypeptidase LdcB